MRDLLRWCLRWFASGEGTPVSDSAMVCGRVLVNPMVRGVVKINPFVSGTVAVASMVRGVVEVAECDCDG